MSSPSDLPAPDLSPDVAATDVSRVSIPAVQHTPAQLRLLGLVEYEDGMRMQAHLVELRQEARIPDQVLLLEHPPVFTLGRRASPEHILIDAPAQRLAGVRVYESVRGGDVTFHGPGQLVLYPILALPVHRQDVGKYVRDLEEVMIRTVADYGLEAGRIPGLSGTWVDGNKVGAIGVRMARWVTSHGIALNVNTALRYFDMIVPCGIRDHGATSLEKLLGKKLSLEEVGSRLLHHFSQVFGVALEPQSIHMRSIQAVVWRRSAAGRNGGSNGGREVLVLRRVPEKGGFWQPVTGRIEQGETPREAAEREVWEETGLRGVVTDLGYVHQLMLDPALLKQAHEPWFCEEHSFAVEVQSEVPGEEAGGVRLEAGAHDAWEWLPLEAAAEKVRWPGNREGILKVGGM